MKTEPDSKPIVFVVDENTDDFREAEDPPELRLDAKETEIEKKSTDRCQSDDRFSLAMRGANDGLWDWNLETNEVYYSARWKSMLGYEENELDPKLDTWASLVHPDDKDRVLQKTKEYLKGQADSFEVEMRMLHKDGHEVFVLSRAVFVPQESSDKPGRLVGTHVDITERKKSEQFILGTSNILKMIATRVPASEIYNAIALLYESRHPGLRCSMLILMGNKLMHGGAPSLPKEYCDAVNGLENGPSVGSCGTATYFGKRVLVENIDTDPKWEKIKHVALPHGMRCCWSEPIKNSTGEVLGAFGMYYNHPALPTETEASDLASAARLAGIIMEREKSENELNQHRHHLEELVNTRTLELERIRMEAEEASRAKSKFLSTMSHELRTPLNAIIGFSQLLEFNPTNSLSEDQRESVEHILKSGEHLLALINEVLDLSQIEAGRLSLAIEPIQLDSVIEEAVELVQTMARNFGVNVVNETSTGSHADIYVVADHLRLKQILLNLLSNGIKYNNPGGTVNIQVFRGSNQHQIVVRDTGIGIEDSNIVNIFNPFERLGAEGKNVEGTGIGLTITKRLVTVMNGELSAESSPGKGTAFTVALPAGEQQSIVNSDDVKSDGVLDGRTSEREETTVLYVEDNYFNIKLVQSILKLRPDVRLVIAETGKAGIELAEQELPALILMDINLPDMSGVDAFKQIQMKEATANIPVVGVSADAMIDTVIERQKEGFKDYITKPFMIDDILGIIDSCISNNNCENRYPLRGEPPQRRAA